MFPPPWLWRRATIPAAYLAQYYATRSGGRRPAEREQAAALIEFRGYLVTSASSRLESLASDRIGHRCAVTIRVLHGKADI
jgi:hypothetical protein